MSLYETQARTKKALALVKVARQVQVSAEDISNSEATRRSLAGVAGVRSPSPDTWAMVVTMLQNESPFLLRLEAAEKVCEAFDDLGLRCPFCDAEAGSFTKDHRTTCEWRVWAEISGYDERVDAQIDALSEELFEEDDDG